MPTNIEIDDATFPDSKSLTSSGYAKLKLTAIAEIEKTTQKGKIILDSAVTDKPTAIVDLQKDYNGILVDWDKTKEELDKEMMKAITDMNAAMEESNQLTANHDNITQDISTN